jgi:hypothetical protein
MEAEGEGEEDETVEVVVGAVRAAVATYHRVRWVLLDKVVIVV